MRIISWNMNGLLSSIKADCFAPIAKLKPDCLCLQEIRTTKEPVIISGFQHFWNHGTRKGYSGTASLSRIAPIRVTLGYGAGVDIEGRVITAEYNQFFLVNIYSPNSQKNLARRAYRHAWDEAFREYVCNLKNKKPVIICGDFNSVRNELDFYEENAQQFNIEHGYLSDERSNLESLLESGFTDVFRYLYPDKRAYTWWSNRLNKRSENRGWRLDYFLVSDNLLPKIRKIRHLTDIMGSDHCPILLDIDFDSIYREPTLEARWKAIDWKAAKTKLELLQAQLTVAAFRQNKDEIVRIQRKIASDIDIRCIAVNHVAMNSRVPGVDGVRWQSGAEKMQAALTMNIKNYKASPMRQIVYKQDEYHRARYPKIPTFRDRAMMKLYSYTLLPVTEANAERKSFAFRPNKSQQDAFAYVMDALKGKDPPEYIVCADVKGFYAHIQHAWILNNVPMEKPILAEFIRAGYVFNGELFPSDDVGISEGFSISPYIANFVLDGLQKYIYKGLYGTDRPDDYSDGNMIRFADDIIVTVRSREHAQTVIELIRDFLTDRGLTLSPEKTVIRSIDEGFTFLSRTFIRTKSTIYAYPSNSSVERFISETKEFIIGYKKSQRELINTLNAKLRGFAEYHRTCDAEKAFRHVDVAVQAALLESATSKHPKLQLAKVKEKYWYKEDNGKYCYALPDDKSVRVMRLADVVLIPYQKQNIRYNPFVDLDLMENKSKERKIYNVSGPYRSVWERQNGLCYYCGRPILTDQARTIVPLSLSRPPSIRNCAYIHRVCEINELENIWAEEGTSGMRTYDVMAALEGIARPKGDSAQVKSPITSKWKYYKLKVFFAGSTAATISLPFKKIEEILGFSLSPSARKDKNWWYPRKDINKISEAWLTEGYLTEKIDLKGKKIVLRRNEEATSKLIIPDVLLNGKIPDNAVFELERHMDYIIKKYGLSGR